jgi:hypothetical protein
MGRIGTAAVMPAEPLRGPLRHAKPTPARKKKRPRRLGFPMPGFSVLPNLTELTLPRIRTRWKVCVQLVYRNERGS